MFMCEFGSCSGVCLSYHSQLLVWLHYSSALKEEGSLSSFVYFLHWLSLSSDILIFPGAPYIMAKVKSYVRHLCQHLPAARKTKWYKNNEAPPLPPPSLSIVLSASLDLGKAHTYPQFYNIRRFASRLILSCLASTCITSCLCL